MSIFDDIVGGGLGGASRPEAEIRHVAEAFRKAARDAHGNVVHMDYLYVADALMYSIRQESEPFRILVTSVVKR